ncbi:MAG: hypothetical protein ACI4L9_02270 [Candidatus Coproplasma sp.]
MKKIIVSLLLTSALATGACVTAGCNVSSSADRNLSDSTASSEGFYTYAAASVGSIISSNAEVAETDSTEIVESDTVQSDEAAPSEEATDSTATDEDLSSEGADVQEPSTDEAIEVPSEPETQEPSNEEGTETPSESEAQDSPTEEQLATINNYMSLVENLLGDGKAGSVVAQSDREGYEIKEVVSFSDLEGNVLSYTMYYNRTLIGAETDEEDHHHGRYGGKSNETETEYSISGIILIGEEEYPLDGRYETEIDGDEQESESFFMVTLSENSFIVMEQEIEDDEQSFVYCIFTDGKPVETVRFSYETEKGETELKMVVVKDGEKSELRFKEETKKDGERRISVRVEAAGQNVSFNIIVTTDEEGNEVYRYQFGEKIKDMYKPVKGKHFGKDAHGNCVMPEEAPEAPEGEADERAEDTTLSLREETGASAAYKGAHYEKENYKNFRR